MKRNIWLGAVAAVALIGGGFSPANAADGITLAGDDATAVEIGLPNADEASTAVVEGEGIVSYDNGDGSTTVPVVKDDGSVQINTPTGSTTRGSARSCSSVRA